MLILTRKVGEIIRINDDITVTVLGVQGGQVRLGTVAPAKVDVHREEIYQRIQTEQGQTRKTIQADHYIRMAAEAKVAQ